MSHHARKGWWKAKNQPPIYVVEDGRMDHGRHGPWVKYRFPWERDEQAKAVLWTAFDELVDRAGYTFAGGEDGQVPGGSVYDLSAAGSSGSDGSSGSEGSGGRGAGPGGAAPVRPDATQEAVEGQASDSPGSEVVQAPAPGKPPEIRVGDLEDKWTKESYDHPNCASCGRQIGSYEEDERREGDEFDGFDEPDIPVRFWRGEGEAMEELALCIPCMRERTGGANV